MLYSKKVLPVSDMPVFKGYAFAWFIRIREDAQNDKPLLVHEIEHVGQFWILTPIGIIPIVIAYFVLPHFTWMWQLIIGVPWSVLVIAPCISLHCVLYWISRKYRQWAEVQAYRVQIVMIPSTTQAEALDHFAEFLTQRYNLKISKEEAIKLLKN